MLLISDQQPKISPLSSIYRKKCLSPHVASLKIAYQTTRQNKLLNIFENMQSNDVSPKFKVRNQSKISGKSGKNRSSFQMYKQKQQKDKQKLQQVHSIEKPKQKSNQFYCTLRIRETKQSKRITKVKNESLQLGTLNSTRSEFHDRNQMKKQAMKTQRECVTQCIPRKQSYPRKYSLDYNIENSMKFVGCMTKLNRNFTFQEPCRPWSPANWQQSFSTPLEGFITLI